MKGRPPILETEEEAIHHYIGCYYEECGKDPEIRHDPDRHLELVERMNGRYLEALSRETAFDYEKYKDCFMECIDFLTKILTKRREKAESSDKKKKFLKDLMKK